MNNMILIRGDEIAFSRTPGSYGDEGNNAHDLKATMHPLGWFIPCHDHGLQALYPLDGESLYQPVKNRTHHSATTGNKGVVCTLEEYGIQYHQARMTETVRLSLTPLMTGTDGSAIISTFRHLTEVMAICVKLTTTTKEAVDMYCRHIQTDRSSVEIWNKKKVYQFMKEHYVPLAMERLKG
jgi:hypothetical protein